MIIIVIDDYTIACRETWICSLSEALSNLSGKIITYVRDINIKLPTRILNF